MGKIRCCYGCEFPKRHLGCHATCEEYIAERKALDEKKAKEHLEREKYRQSVEVDIKGIERAKKLAKKRWR